MARTDEREGRREDVEVPEKPLVMPHVLLCMLGVVEVVKGKLCLLGDAGGVGDAVK